MAIDFSKIASPSFVLEERLLKRNLELLKKVQDEAGIEIILAFKGFAMWSAFPMVRGYLAGATASSLNEVQLCFEEMATKSHTYMVAYRDEEIHEICEKSSHITFNSLNQLVKYKQVAIDNGCSIGIRVNPEYSEVETDLYNPSSPQSRLGMTAKHFGNELPEGIEGLHFHVLCESDSVALENTLREFELKFGKFLHQVKWVNFGGGHLMTREGYDIDHLISILKNFKEKYDLDIILEPGSAIAWETGYLVTQVLDIVENGDVKTAIIDASFTCHMPDCLEMPYRPLIHSANSNPEKGDYRYRIGGLSCLAGDYLEEYGFSTPLDIGDQLIFNDMIHYTMVKTNTFNGVAHPSIGIWRMNDTFELIRTFGYDDFKTRLS